MSKILIVEDIEMNRDMLSRRLERKGFEVVMAEDGAKGVDMSKSESPDLILMDLSLPVMDGWEATSTIKADDSTKNIPIIVLTAHAMAEIGKRHWMRVQMSMILSQSILKDFLVKLKISSKNFFTWIKEQKVFSSAKLGII